MAQQRPITCRGNTRSYPDGNESDDSRVLRGDIKARKRNSVACARCRKRKIKCTGDLHDGKGCEACQAAGVPGRSCHYLRVNSHHIEEIALQSSNDSELYYPAPAPGNYMNRITTDPSQYALANVSHMSPHVPSPYAGPGVPYSTAQARPPFATNYPTSYNNQYDVQRPIQGQPLQGPTPNYSALDYSQQWNSLSPNGRPTSHTLLYEQDPSRYETSYVTSSSTSVPNVAGEGSSIFPGLSPLVTHLPAHGGNRTLPEPMNMHSSFDSSNGSLQGSDGDAGLYQQHLETGTSQESVSSASQDAISATGQTSSTPSSSPSETQEMPTFGYIPMTQTSPNAALDPGMAVRNGSVYDSHGRPRILQPQPRRSPSYDLLKGSFEGSGKHAGRVLKPNGHGRRPDRKR